MALSSAARERRLAYQKQYYRNNKASVLKKTNAWRAENRERVNALARKRSSGNAELAARRREKRATDIVGPAYERLVRSAAGAPHATRKELHSLWVEQNNVCGLTGVAIPKNIKPHLDHKLPQAKGGAHTVDNLRWTHPMANRAKGKHSDAEFLVWWNSR